MMKIAVIGLGNHALKNTLPALARCRQLDLVGCYARDTNKTKKIAEQYQINHWIEEAAVYADENVDIVYIATPTGLHFTQVKNALMHGKHVFCEKSLVCSLSQAEQLCQLAEDNQLLLAECFMYFYHKQYAQLVQMCEEKVIGDIKSITARFGYPHLPPDNIRYSAALGGGALLDAGVYPLSLLNAFSGEGLAQFNGHISRENGYQVDTNGAAFSVMANGICAHAQWGMGLDYSNDIQIWGTQGQIYVERAFAKPTTLSTKIQVMRNGQKEDIDISGDDHFVNMFSSFAQAIGDTEKTKILRVQILAIASMVERLKASSNSEI